MKFSVNRLSGKLVLFFGIVSIIIVSFIIYILKTTSEVNRRSRQVEQVYFPLTQHIEDLVVDLDRHMASLMQDVTQKNTSGYEQRVADWSATTSHMQILKDNSSIFSDQARVWLDSLPVLVNLVNSRDQEIKTWIEHNYLNAPTDSAFQATLYTREQAELVPLVSHAGSLQHKLTKYLGQLSQEIDARVKTDSARISRLSKQTQWVSSLVTILILGMMFTGGAWLIRRFTASLSVSGEVLDHIVKGEVSEYLEPSRDEFGAIIDSANKINNNLKQYSLFAQSIGEGNIDFAFTPVSDNDLLGNSLVQMKQKLKAIDDDDKKRRWVTEGLAGFADIMRKSDDYEALAYSIVSELVKYTKSNQGGLFIVNRDDEKETYLQLTACYAFERRKYLQKRVDIGEGLVGQSYQERRTIYLKEIPPDYVTITSGLGGANPSSLLIVPLKVNDVIEGVIEMASFKDYQPHEIDFVEKVGEIIASTISNARINSRTRKLLEESQQHAEELRAQEEEMRQNMEEMQATQEQMHRQAEEMRKMHERLDLERSMFQVLMEYLPDRITYKDRESKILRVNKAKAIRFKVTAEEMIGKTDYDYFAKDHADKAVQEEQELLRLGEPMLNIEERAVLSNGDVVWASTSRIPFKNSKGETIGMFIITKDVTQLRIAEASIRDREKIIQRLLDNMPVFRYSIGKNGYITDFWKSKVLGSFPSLDHKPVQDFLPEVHDLLHQEELEDTGLICKTVMELDGEKEIFKHFLFKDSAHEGACLGFALKQ